MRHSMLGWAVHAELTKTITLRSLMLTAATTVAVSGVLGYLAGLTGRSALAHGPAAADTGYRPELAGYLALLYSQVGVITLGALSATSEYASGQIRTSLTAVPSRGLLLVSKIIAVTAVGLVVSATTVVVTGFTATVGLGDRTATAWTALHLLVSATLYLTGMGLLGFALGMLVRHAVVPIVVLIVLTQALSTVLSNSAATRAAAKFLPDLAGLMLFLPAPPGRPALAPAAGGLVLAAWVTVTLWLAYLALTRRDA